MTKKELEDKHEDIKWQQYKGDKEVAKAHAKLSIEFVISILNPISLDLYSGIEQEHTLTEWGLGYQQCSKDIIDSLESKVQKLKTYLENE